MEAATAPNGCAVLAGRRWYYWTPFDPPQRGRSEISAVWQGAVSQQRDIHMTFEVLAVEANRGVARWHTNFTTVPAGEPVQLDGILIAEFEGRSTAACSANGGIK